MRCPSCHGSVPDKAWICPECDHIIDPSVLGDDFIENRPEGRAERTQLVAWSPDDDYESVPDAVILGDVAVDSNEFSVVQGAGASGDGRTATYLFYTSGATARIIHPDSFPSIAARDTSIPYTPYEDFLLSCIDGQRSVRAITRLSGLAPQEVVVTLLTLLDKGAIRIRPPSSTLDEEDSEQTEDFPIDSLSPPAREPGDPTEPLPVVPTRSLPQVAEELPTHSAPAPRGSTASPSRKREGLGEGSSLVSAVVPADFEDLPSVSDFHELPDAEAMPDLSNQDPALLAPTRQLSSLSGVWAPPREDSVPPPVPLASLEGSEEMTTKSRAVPKPPERGRAHSLTVGRPASNPNAPVLDASFLEEVPASDPGSSIEVSSFTGRGLDPEAEGEGSSLASVYKPSPDPSRLREGEEPSAPVFEPVDRHRMMKAQKLYEQALKDKAEGNLVSARMNMKLALTFDPNLEECSIALEEISKHADSRPVAAGRARDRARELYDAATTAENRGDVDGAIRNLEEAIKVSEQAPFYNRLGVIVAMKKRDYAKAQELVERALEMAPGNPSYTKNLQKILAMAATAAPVRGDKKGGLLGGLLGRRR